MKDMKNPDSNPPGFLGSRVLIGIRLATGVHAGTQEARRERGR